MKKYRISKFNPKFRKNNWTVFEDTWTSYSDIGKFYENKKFTQREYLKTEKKYIKVILNILYYFDIEKLYIRNIELNFSISELKAMLGKAGLIFTMQEIKILNSLSENKEIIIDNLPLYLKLILRECFWGGIV